MYSIQTKLFAAKYHDISELCQDFPGSKLTTVMVCGQNFGSFYKSRTAYLVKLEGLLGWVGIRGAFVGGELKGGWWHALGHAGFLLRWFFEKLIFFFCFPTDDNAHGVNLSWRNPFFGGSHAPPSHKRLIGNWQQRHAQDPCRLRLAGIEMKEDQLRCFGGMVE